MAIVHIYLPTEGAPTEWIRALSIPHKDIERLALRPLKWLRFATFTVCGAKGDLSATRGGEIVDYENVSFDDLADEYYYTPDGSYHLVDLEAFNDRCTSTIVTPRHNNFRENICRRDESCVITRADRRRCDAAHIIPRSKGNNYITFVVRDRSSLYEQLPSSFGGNIDINCVENGMLLRKDLHGDFGMGGIIVFLKTPNFAMVPDDVPRVEQGPIPHNRTTLQYMDPPMGLYLVLQGDIQADWSGDEVPSPPNILLDFKYGAAIVKRWMCDDLGEMLQKQFKDAFSNVLAENPTPSASDDDESEVDPDDPKDPDFRPRKGKQKERKRFSSDAEAGLLQAMDRVLFLSMFLKGTTPQSMVAEWEKQDKEKELRAQEHSSEKVQQWLNLDAGQQ